MPAVAVVEARTVEEPVAVAAGMVAPAAPHMAMSGAVATPMLHRVEANRMLVFAEVGGCCAAGDSAAGQSAQHL